MVLCSLYPLWRSCGHRTIHIQLSRLYGCLLYSLGLIYQLSYISGHSTVAKSSDSPAGYVYEHAVYTYYYGCMHDICSEWESKSVTKREREGEREIRRECNSLHLYVFCEFPLSCSYICSLSVLVSLVYSRIFSYILVHVQSMYSNIQAFVGEADEWCLLCIDFESALMYKVCIYTIHTCVRMHLSMQHLG